MHDNFHGISFMPDSFNRTTVECKFMENAPMLAQSIAVLIELQ